jgi:hypothetical protein
VTAPVLEVRVDWRRAGFSEIANDGFEVDTTGWSVGAGINAAGSSITRTAGGYAGGYCGRLVTSATSGSGCNYDFGGTTFTVGRTYRFRVYIKSVSGTTSARILIGSLGTVGDRASWTGTITGSWAAYTVDWTPSGTRTDVEVVVSNNTTLAMTADLDHAEVFETIQDVTAYVTNATWSRGFSPVSGGADIGSCTLTVRNDDQRFDPGNAGGAYGTNVKLGREVWVRSTYGGAPYAHFHGTVAGIALRPNERLAELVCVDMFDELERSETSVAASVSRAVSTFRGLVLDDVGVPSLHRDISTADPETMIPLTEADQASALGVLEAMNEATGTVHFIRPHVSASVLSEYVSIARPELATGPSVQALDGANVMVEQTDYSVDDIVNVMKVIPVGRGLAPSATLWERANLPLTVNPGETRTLWARWDDPAFSQAVVYSATGSPTVTLTAFSRSAKITIVAGGSAAVVTALSVTGQAYEALDQEAAEYRIPSSVTEYMVRSPKRSRISPRAAPKPAASTIGLYGRREAELASDYINGTAHAQGLASWWVYRYNEPPIRPTVTVKADDPATQVSRELADRILLTGVRLSLSAVSLIITGLTTDVAPGGAWVTTYATETAPTANVWFTLGGTADEGIGGSGILAY